MMTASLTTPSACSAYSAVTTVRGPGHSFLRAYQPMASGTVVVVGGAGSGVNVPPVKMPNRRMDVVVSGGSPYWM